MSCAELEPGRLVDYWIGELPAAEEEAVEAHVFSCATCGAGLVTLAELASGIGRLAGAGRLRAVVPWSLVKRLGDDGVAVRVFEVRPGERVPCSAAPQDQLLVARLAVDLGDADRVDLTIDLELDAAAARSFPTQQRMADVPVDQSRREVVLAFRADLVHALPPHVIHLKLLAPTAGGERVLGDYTLDHSPWRGPPS